MRDRIISLLQSTGRENMDKVIAWMDTNGFFDAPASVKYHNTMRGGLARHSMDVYEEAVKLNDARVASGKAPLPETSIIICSLLHDICKSDQYFITGDGKPACRSWKKAKGHGRRSMLIVKSACKVPLNYDEEMAIWWHMGEHEDSMDRFPGEYQESQKNELCRLIRSADGIAAKK